MKISHLGRVNKTSKEIRMQILPPPFSLETDVKIIKKFSPCQNELNNASTPINFKSHDAKSSFDEIQIEIEKECP